MVLDVQNLADPFVHLLGTLLISTSDAIVVAIRFLASATVCRIILTYELHGMKEVVSVAEREEDAISYETILPSDSASAEKTLPVVRMTM